MQLTPFSPSGSPCPPAPLRAAALVLLAVMLAGAPALAGEVAGHGDFGFYLDTVAFRGRAGHDLAEVSIRIPNNELRFVVDKGVATNHSRLSVLIEDVDGKAVIKDAEDRTFTESDAEHATSSLYFQTVIKRYQLEPGIYLLSYAIEDLDAPKTSLVGRMKDQNRTSVVRDLRLELPSMPDDEPSFSQAKFLWDVGEEHDGRHEYHPNPPRLYGLYKDTLMVYMELYLPDSLAHAPGFRFQSLLLNARGEEMKVTNVDLPAAGDGEGGTTTGGVRTYPILLREDLSRFPAGTYSLRVSFFMGDRPLSRARAGGFSVAWDLRTWEVPRREMLAEARFLLGDKEFDAFQKLSLGDQEQTLDQTWKRIDPTPETDVNEAYETFLARLAYVNEHFSDFGPAIFDPRGQLYVRLGPPDELVQDVIPLNRETVSEAVEAVDDPYHAISFSTHGVKQYNRGVGRENIIDPRSLAGEREGDNVAYPFELWIYHTAGDPILPRDDVKEIDIGMRYLFVDRKGYGHYKLESSSSISNK